MEKLRHSTVLVAGVGGLGGAAATYLAAAGIGRLILLHDGVVEWSDLNRQTLMGWDGVGRSRVQQAKTTLQRLYPTVQLDTIDGKVIDIAMDAWIDQVDMVLDARYDLDERYVLNRLCVEHNVPMIEAAMNGWELYVMAVVPHAGPCLRCLFIDGMPWQGKGFPVLGTVCATAGTLAANETIKHLSGLVSHTVTPLYWFDLLTMQQRTIQVQRLGYCPVCGDEVEPGGERA